MTITTAQLDAFVAAVTAKVDAYKEKQGFVLPVTFSYEVGPKYVRIVRADASNRSVFCFVERSTGNILKAAGWKAPAKHARGNIANGANDVGPYGPAYLR